MDKLDFKKAYKDLYLPKDTPALIEVPPIPFLLVDGKGSPDSAAYQHSVELLYALSYAIKMSKMGGNAPAGYIDYVVPPLEGLWDSEAGGYDPDARDRWVWTSMIRQPDFVTAEVFGWACDQVRKKKPGLDVSAARFAVYDEGLCVQILHIGPFHTEPASVAKLAAFIGANGLRDDCGPERRHHEIYLGDPRKTDPAKMKTVLRHPVARI